MNEEHKEWLRRIEALLDEFAEDQTHARLQVVYDELLKLCKALAATGYTGIDLTILRFLRFDVRDGLRGLFDAKAEPAVIAAECLRLRTAINRLLYTAKAIARPATTTAAAPNQPGVELQASQEPPKSAAPVVTLAKITYCVGGGLFWDAATPDSPYKLTSPLQSLIVLRELGLKKLRWLRVELLSPEETLWVFDVLRKTYDDYDYTDDLILNIEILGPNRQRLHVRLTVTKKRTKAVFCYETRAMQRAQGQGKSLEQVKAELIGEFSLRSIEEAPGAAWAVTDLLEVQAAFLKIPIADRGALRNLVLRRRKFAPDKDSGEGKEMGCYTPAEHCLLAARSGVRRAEGLHGGGCGCLSALPLRDPARGRACGRGMVQAAAGGVDASGPGAPGSRRAEREA
ncbi:hypothetical protein ACU686_35550 [Yinghuangia aomiensis]